MYVLELPNRKCKLKARVLSNNNPCFPCLFMPLGEREEMGIYYTSKQSDSGLKHHVLSNKKPPQNIPESLNCKESVNCCIILPQLVSVGE